MEPEKNTNSNAEEKKLDQPTVIPSIQPVRRLNVKTLTNNIFPLQISPNVKDKKETKFVLFFKNFANISLDPNKRVKKSHSRNFQGSRRPTKADLHGEDDKRRRYFI